MHGRSRNSHNETYYDGKMLSANTSNLSLPGIADVLANTRANGIARHKVNQSNLWNVVVVVVGGGVDVVVHHRAVWAVKRCGCWC